MITKTRCSLTFILIIQLSLVTACSLAPDYERPAMNIPDDYKDAGDWVLANPSAASLSRGPWWEMYEDPQLNELMLQLSLENQDLKIAFARYENAKAIAAQARSYLFPTIDALIVPSRQETSQNTANPAPNPLFSDVFIGADLSYEVDLWGQVRNSAVAADAQAKASQVQIVGAELSLHAMLATFYFNLRSADLAEEALSEMVIAYEKSLHLNQMLYEGGAVPVQVFLDAQAQLGYAKTLATDMELIRAQLENAIAVLVGQIPADFSVPAIKNYQQKVITVNPQLPSTLLERRPDVAAAELQVQAANANIGVARAAYFPSFFLVATLGLESANINNLFNASSLVWALGPSAGPSELGTVITGPTVQQIIYDGGRIEGLNDQAWAMYQETVANYRQTVLTAYQEVEDNLVAMHQLGEEDFTQTASNMATHRIVDQAFYRYDAGLTTFLDVAAEQIMALKNDLVLIDIRNRHQIASVQLIKALGGGWTIHDEFANFQDE